MRSLLDSDRRTAIKALAATALGGAGAAGATTTATAHGQQAADEFAVSIRETNAPVTGGAELTVRCSLARHGDDPTGQARETMLMLVVGGDGPEVFDYTTVSMVPQSTAIRQLSFTTYPVQVDVEFPIRAVVDWGDADTEMVTVYGR